MRCGDRSTGVLWLALVGLMSGCASAEMPAPAAPPMPELAPATPADASKADEAGSFRPVREENRAPKVIRAHMPASPPGAPPPPPPAPEPGKREAGGDAVQLRGPMLIYTAQITMAVFEVNASLSKVEAIGREFGGFLAKRDDRSVTIRVPAQRFDEAVKRCEDVGDMLHRNVAAEDVTEEFRDLEVRMSSARAVQKRLTELLARATKVEESIAIERELDRVTGEIERVEGRMKFLRDRAAFSTITVTFEPKPKEHVGTSVRLPFNWLYDLGLRRLLSL